MSKGRKPPRDNPPIRPREADGDPGGETEQCWTFHLVDTTPAAARAATGASISGSVQRRRRVMVTAGGDALGFAPDATASEMIAAAAETGGSLRGSIAAADETGRNVLAELCLRV